VTQSPHGSHDDEARFDAGTSPEGEQHAPSPEVSGDGPLDDAAAPAGEKPDQPEAPFEAPAAAEVDGEGGGDVELEDDLSRARSDLAGLTSDLQRLQAEYLNYKRRVERDRELIRENATYTALVPIIEVLDTIDRAREHAPLEDGFKTVAEQLERVVAKQGLTRFGEAGDAFDPNLHEALSHIGQDPEVSVTTCKVIAKAGYRIGDRVVRAAQVLVVDPADAG